MSSTLRLFVSKNNSRHPTGASTSSSDGNLVLDPVKPFIEYTSLWVLSHEILKNTELFFLFNSY